tara:strand:+ start:932 stop:1681 length:750 start_codon:yes stop_codon:yes gene_type:complete
MIDKAIVFDLDHTIGDFLLIGILWKFLCHVNCSLNQSDFNNICEIFPEIFRPNIFTIFKYLCKRKNLNKNIKLIIYSNNQAGKSWINMINEYINYKINDKVFDFIIGPYKLKNEIVEKCRHCNEKTYEDVINCCGISDKAEILFLDDLHHPKMEHNKVFYINIKKYNNKNKTREIIDRFMTANKYSSLFSKHEIGKLFVRYIKKINKDIEKTEKELELDKVITKAIMNHILNFLNNNKHNKTRKKKRNY